MSEIQEKTAAEAELPQEQLRQIMDKMVLTYGDTIHGHKVNLHDMSVEELLRFLSHAMKFDAMVVEAVADELKKRGAGDAKLPDDASDKLRKKAKASKWASFWRKQK